MLPTNDDTTPNEAMDDAADEVTLAAIFADLAPAQQRFVQCLFQEMAEPDAMLAAGYRYATRASASARAQELKHVPAVAHAIERYRAFLAQKASVHALDIVAALKVQAFYDPKDIMADGETWTFKALDAWPVEIRQCVQRIKVNEVPTKHGITRQIDIHFTDRQRALELLGKYRRLWDEKRQNGSTYHLTINTQPHAPELDIPKPVRVIDAGVVRIELPESTNDATSMEPRSFEHGR